MSQMTLDEYTKALQYSLVTYQLRRTDIIVDVLIKLFNKGKGKNNKKEIKVQHDSIEDFIMRRNREAMFEINS